MGFNAAAEQSKFLNFIADDDLVSAFESHFVFAMLSVLRNGNTEQTLSYGVHILTVFRDAFDLKFIENYTTREGALIVAGRLAEYVAHLKTLGLRAPLVEDLEVSTDVVANDLVSGTSDEVIGGEDECSVEISSDAVEDTVADVVVSCCVDSHSGALSDDSVVVSESVNTACAVYSGVADVDAVTGSGDYGVFRTRENYDNYLRDYIVSIDRDAELGVMVNYGITSSRYLDYGSCWLNLFDRSDWYDLKYEYRLPHRLDDLLFRSLQFLPMHGGPPVVDKLVCAKIVDYEDRVPLWHIKPFSVVEDVDYGIVAARDLIGSATGSFVMCKWCMSHVADCPCEYTRDDVYSSMARIQHLYRLKGIFDSLMNTQRTASAVDLLRIVLKQMGNPYNCVRVQNGVIDKSAYKRYCVLMNDILIKRESEHGHLWERLSRFVHRSDGDVVSDHCSSSVSGCLKSGVPELSVVLFYGSVNTIDRRHDCVYLVFTQCEKATLRRIGFSNVSTITESTGGADTATVCLIRTDYRNLDIYSNVGLLRAVLSMPVQSLVYYTPVVDDKMARLIDSVLMMRSVR